MHPWTLFLSRWMHPPTQKIFFESVEASTDSKLESEDASTDPKRRVGGGLLRPKRQSRWKPLPTQNWSRWRHPPTPVLGRWRHPPTLFFGSADASTDPKNDSSCRLSTDCKAFSNGITLKHHLRIHSDEKPLPCNECYKSFSNGGSLKEHFYQHTRLKNHFLVLNVLKLSQM